MAFANLKDYLSSAPLLGKSNLDEELYLYLAILPVAMSAALVQEQNKIQELIYYISWILRDAETRYSKLENLAYALLIAARKLRLYFQAHIIILLTDQPRKDILHHPDISGQITKWAVEFSKFDI